MKTFLREPLVHFLIAGAFLFVLFEFTGDKAASVDNVIIVGKSQIEQFRTAWQKQWRRMPTEKELQGLIEQHIGEEVLYREAIALGLEKNDTIVRRRLAQKMKFLIQDIADQNTPGEAELQSFFKENIEQFRFPALISFIHVFLNPDYRDRPVDEDARNMLERLKAQDMERPEDMGDPFMLNHEYTEITEQETARLFGSRFATDIFTFAPGEWRGPVTSGYGVHLVRVLALKPSRLPDFGEVRDKVYDEYMAAQRLKANEAAIAGIKARYRIVIEADEITQEKANSASGNKNGDAS